MQGIRSEDEWLACTEPATMLELLLGTTRLAIATRANTRDTWLAPVSERKLRLYAVACFNRLRDLLSHPLARTAVDLAEQAADGLVPPEDLERAHADVRRAADEFEAHWRASRGAAREAALPVHAALALALQVTHADAGWAAWYSGSNASWTAAASAHPGAASYDGAFLATTAAEKSAQAGLLRDIFGPLTFGPALDPRWRDPTAVGLARAIYAEKAFDRLPTLADALRDAGCDSPGILRHCSSAEPHVRGCWVIDWIVGMGQERA